MPSPQEEYTYQQLVHYYDVSKTALSNYKKKYPFLDIELKQAGQDVYGELQAFISEIGTSLVKNNAYLYPDEQEGIEIGSVVPQTEAAKEKKLLKRIQKNKEMFLDELTDLVQLHEIRLKGLYLEHSRMSAKFTADRIQELRRREQWVKTQQDYISNYYFIKCRKYRSLIDITLLFARSISVLPQKSGIYILFKNGEIMYIGHSTNIQKRIRNHKLVPKSYRDSGPFEIECVYARMSVYNAQKLEKELIQVARPEFNVQSKV